MIVITGAAGFIGSALAWALNERGREDLLLVDDVDHPEKEHNLKHLRFSERVGIADFRERLKRGDYDSAKIEGILHLGACSDTGETDWDYLQDNNVAYSQELIRWCVEHGARCVYASSAATYGDGELGFDDDPALFGKLTPMNLYGKSKLLIDQWAQAEGLLDTVVGIRYFNVYGPNEAHKEHIRSVIAKQFEHVRDEGKVELFKSYKKGIGHGEQDRDFIYVKDAVAATLFFFDHPEIGGVYNVGTGNARTWNDVANAMFAALGKEPNIQYIDMPEKLKGQYQYHTEATIDRLRQAGFTADMTSLEDAVKDYVQEYLVPHRHLGE